MQYNKTSIQMTTNRIEALTDGIFAIAMTLMVLSLVVPDIGGQLSNLAVQNALYGLLPSFYTLVLSFILLSLFWKIHHNMFQRIKQVNGPLLWINMAWLLFIVLVPFSASLTGKYGEFTISHVIFNINMIGISVLLLLNWHYANRTDSVHEKVDDVEIRTIKADTTLFMFISVLALLLCFIVPRAASSVYILIFPFEFILHKYIQ